MQETDLPPFPILKTERLTLRQLKDTDDLAVSILRSDERVNTYIDRPKQTSVAEAKAFIININAQIEQSKCFYWAICLKNIPDLIGTICLWKFLDDRTTAELGYELNPSFQGWGLMNEAVKCILEYGFQTIWLKSIDAYVHKDNDNSMRLLVKNNFKPDVERKDKENINNIIFTLARHPLQGNNPNDE